MYVCALEVATQSAQVHGEQKAVEGAGEHGQQVKGQEENQGQDIFHVTKTYLLHYKLFAQAMQTFIFIAAVVCM